MLGSSFAHAACAAFALTLFTTTAAAQTTPTFAADVAPLLAARCGGCHHPGGPAPFSVQTYDDVAPRAAAIAIAVERRVMPPWKPTPGLGGPFVGERRLSDAEIALLRQWADAGAPRGAAPEPAASHDHGSEWQLGSPDLVVEMPGTFQLQPGGLDVFRNFAVRLPTERSRYIRGIEFQPLNHRVTHHANMRIDPTSGSVRLDSRDAQPGYEGIASPTAVFPDGYFLGWTPGQVAPLLPPGLGWRLAAGSTLVVELHLVPTDTVEDVGFRVGLYFTDTPPARTPVMLRLGRQNIDIPAGEARYVIRDEFTLPVSAAVQSVQPHAHYLATLVQGYARLPDGTRRWLIQIADWDFHTQDVYRYVTPVTLPKGTTIHMEYVYDNSARNRRNPTSPPARVRWGQFTHDEMGDLWLQLLPDDPADQPLLTQRVRAKEMAEDIVGYRMLLDRAPGDGMIRANLADALVRTGRRDEALRHLREHVRIEPASALAHYNLATVLAASNQPEAAANAFRRALALEPGDAFAHNGLGGVLNTLGDSEGALGAFTEAVRLDPSYGNAYNNLGATLVRLNRDEEAFAAFVRAIEIDPANGDAHFNLGELFESHFNYVDAARAYREALTLRPDDATLQMFTAWVLATAPIESVRRPEEAVLLARAAAETRPGDPQALDILGAAEAATGQFDRAMAAARRAVELLERSGNASQLAAVSRRLSQYGRRQPFLSPASPQ